MKQSIGEVSTLNIIIIFIVVVFGLLSATLNYYKAFKLNSRIIDIMEKYEGYNTLARNEITTTLNGLGYHSNTSGWHCPNIKIGGTSVGPVSASDADNVDQSSSHYYCVYYVANDGSTSSTSSKDFAKKNLDNEPIYYNYVVVTYIFVDLPIVGQFKIPVKTKGERTYNFSEHAGNPIAR